MEKAIFNGNPYIAIDVANSFEAEERIRIASGRKELRCPDADCKNPILKYCHGKKKVPYFSHLNNCSCDYAIFDRETAPILRKVKIALYKHLLKQGFDVKLDVKIIPHHYTHILVTLCNREVALEFGTSKMTACKIEELTYKYKELGVDVRWIEVSEHELLISREEDAVFIERYSLNKSETKDVLDINSNDNSVIQYAYDTRRYEYEGKELTSHNYPQIYHEKANISELTFEKERLAISGFYDRFELFLTKKRDAFDKKIAQLNQEKEQRERLANENRWTKSGVNQGGIRKSPSKSVRYYNNFPEPKEGMELQHRGIGWLIIECVEKSNKTTIYVSDAWGNKRSLDWNFLCSENVIEIVKGK